MATKKVAAANAAAKKVAAKKAIPKKAIPKRATAKKATAKKATVKKSAVPAARTAQAPARLATKRTDRGDVAAARSASGGLPELIYMTHEDAGIRVGASGVASRSGSQHRTLNEIAARNGVTMTPLFGQEDRVQRATAAAARTSLTAIPNLSVFYHVDAEPDRLAALAEELLSIPEVAAAYVKPAGEPPVMTESSPAPGDAPPMTPDFVSRQTYLGVAPGGIDAEYAWTFPGGSGAGVSIIDCEWGWRFDHEDLVMTQGGVVIGTGGTDTNHGTAVLGEMSGDRNANGVIGICPDAFVSAAAFGASAATIRSAADRLSSGDFILLEIHRAGPRNNFAARGDQHGYIAIEWWPDDFAAIAYATGRGVIVIEAAGNGAQDLDDALYSTRPVGFPVTWTNPFNRANRDCGAILVGAGAPPTGTHGHGWGADRSRLDFSNFGASIDAQGWGREVTTTGYGDLQGGADARLWYTDTFSGTSSASPIVTGALGSLQGALRAAGRAPMTPATARNWLRSTGSAQQDEPGRPASQRIGNRPDLRQLFNAHVKGSFLADKVTKFEGKEGKDLRKEKVEIKEIKIEIKEIKEPKEFKEGFKELKEPKEFKEGKELRENKRISDTKLFDQKQIRENKLIEKQIRENKLIEQKIAENKLAEQKLGEGIGGDIIGGIIGGIVPEPDSLGTRLAAVEQSLAVLTHFISQELRPDLNSGALTREPDMWDAAEDAKSQKDFKDKEHLAEQ
jgi:Subtilase family